MIARRSLTARIALALLLMGVAWLGGWIWWATAVPPNGFDDDARDAWVVGLSFSTVGGILMIRAAAARRSEKLDDPIITNPLTSPSGDTTAYPVDERFRHLRAYGPYHRTRTRGSQMPPAPGLPQLMGIFATLLLLVISFRPGWPVPPTGIRVRLLHPGAVLQPSPGIQPLRLTLMAATPLPRLYLNSEPVTWKDLPSVLTRELAKRPPEWPVYLDGDREMAVVHVIRAMDIIRGAGAAVVLLTRAPLADNQSHPHLRQN